jgi:hypothetical protein
VCRFWTYQCPFIHLIAHIASSKPSISLDDAVKATENTLGGRAVKRKDSDISKYLGYLAKEDGSAVLTYGLVIINAAISRRLRAFVDAHSGHIISIVDLVLNASTFNDKVLIRLPSLWNLSIRCNSR